MKQAFVPGLVVLCALGRAATAAESPPASAIAAQRLELRREDGGQSAAERARRLRALAGLEERAGNPDLAAAAAREYLDTVAAGALAQALGNRDPAGALDPLREAVRYAVAAGDRLKAPQLVLAALAWMPEELPANKAILMTALLRAEQSSPMPADEQLMPLFSHDPAWQLLLEDASEKKSVVSDDAAARLGPLGRTVLDRRLSWALGAGKLPAARRLANLLLAADRWHLRARVIGHLLDDIERRHVVLPAEDVAAATSSSYVQRRPVVVRLQRLYQQRPDAIGVGLALAHRLLEVHLHADARRLAEPLARAAGATADERATAEAIVAAAALIGAQPELYSRWSAANGGDASWSCVQRVLEGEADWKATPAVRPLARAALRQVFKAPFGPTTREAQQTWAREAALAFDEPTLQARGRAVLAEVDTGAARATAGCLQERLDEARCRQRLQHRDEWAYLDEDDGELSDEAADALEQLPDIEASSLEGIPRAGAERLRRLGPWLDRLPQDRYGGTSAFVWARLATYLTAGEMAPAQTFFARWKMALSRGQRLAMHLILRRGARKIPPDTLLAQLWPLPSVVGLNARESVDGLNDEGESEDDEDEDESGASESLPFALHALHTDPKRALRLLRPVWKSLDGLDGAELAGFTYLAAAADHNRALRAEALARVRRLAPESAVASHLALDAVGADRAAALALARRVLSLAPGSVKAADDLARTWLAAEEAAGLTPELRAWLTRAARGLPGSSFATLDRAIEHGLVRTTEELRRLERSLHDNELRLDFSPALEQHSPSPVVWWSFRRLATVEAARMVPLARRVIGYTDRGKPGTMRQLRAWSLFLTGDNPAALRALDQPDPSPVDPQMAGWNNTEPDVPLRLLAQMRAPLEVSLRQKMLRLFHQYAFRQTKDDLPRELAARAEQPGHDGDRPLLRALACHAAGTLARTRQAISLCARAWNAGDRSVGVATLLARFVAETPDAARLEGLDAEAFFRVARQTPGPASPELLHHHAAWLSQLQRHGEAAAAEADAWAAGYRASSGADADVYGWVRYQPLLARYHLASSIFQSGQRNMTVATAALVGADLGIAVAHQKALEAGGLSQVATEHRDWADLLGDVIALALVDLQEQRLDGQGLQRVAYALVRGKVEPELATFRQRAPRSYLVSTLSLEGQMTSLHLGANSVEVMALSKRFPRNFIVARLAFVAHILGKRLPEARAMLAHLKAAFPGDRRLDLFQIPGESTSAASSLPWLKTAKAWNESLAAASIGPILDSKTDPLKHHQGDDGVDVFLPDSFQEISGRSNAFYRETLQLAITRAPRMTHCEAPACLEEMAAVLRSVDVKPVWSQPVHLPAGDGQEGLFQGPAGVLSVVAVPLGPHTYFLAAGGSPEQLRAGLPAVRLFRETFRAGQLLHGPARTRFLRGQTYLHAEPPVQARARLAVAQPQSRCPLTSLLAPLTPAMRGSVLLDLLLTAPSADLRRTTLACATPERPEAAVLALPALWDLDDGVQQFGRRAVAHHSRRVSDLLRSGLADDDLATDNFRSEEPLGAGLLAALLALPSKSQTSLATRWLGSGEPRLRALALASLHFAPDALAASEQTAIVRSGEPADVRLLLNALPPHRQAHLLDPARTRLDGIPARPAAGEADLVVLLVNLLSRQLDQRDLPRLAKSRAQLETAGATGRHAFAIHQIAAHALGCGGKEKPSGPVSTLLSEWRLETSPGYASTFDERSLAGRALPAGWSYFRIGHPGAFVASLADLGRRLIQIKDARISVGQMMLLRGATADGADQLAQSGLDLDSPFECAVRPGARGQFVCSAGIKDPAALQRRLATTPPGRGLPTQLPYHLGSLAFWLPEVALYLPFLLEEPPASVGAAPPSPVAAERLVAERIDDTPAMGGARSRRRTQLHIDRNGRATAAESLTLVAGRRLWIFSDDQVARTYVAGTAGRGPQDRPTVLLGLGEREGALLRATIADDDTPDARSSLEVAVISDGVRIRTWTRSRVPASDVGVLGAALPPSPVARFAASTVEAPPLHRPGGSLPFARPRNAPPEWLWEAAGAASFGWYPHKGDDPWTRWVSVMPWSDGLAGVWKQRGMPPLSESPVLGEGILYARRGPFLIAGTDPTLLAAVRVPAPRAGASSVVEARVDGAATREILEALAARKGASERISVMASLSAMVDRIQLSGTRKGDLLGVETLFHTPARSTADPALVDEWLRSTRLRNSLALPRILSPAELSRPVTLGVRVSRPQDLERAFPATARVSIASDAAGPKIRILPAAPAINVAPVAPPRGVRAPPVQAAAREIVGRLQGPVQQADAILRWVHSEMTYEVTPGYLDDITLLSRKRGDCTEYSQLAIALLQATGIPARMRSGFLIAGPTLVAHAWLEYFDGRAWQEADPTNGRTNVDASYVDASVLEVMSLISVGQIEITSIQ